MSCCRGGAVAGSRAGFGAGSEVLACYGFVMFAYMWAHVPARGTVPCCNAGGDAVTHWKGAHVCKTTVFGEVATLVDVAVAFKVDSCPTPQNSLGFLCGPIACSILNVRVSHSQLLATCRTLMD